MKINLAQTEDIPAIMSVVKDAQEYLFEQGIDQWQDGYPDNAQIELDISNRESYIVVDRTGVIIGTTVLSTKNEPSYNKIDGDWMTSFNSKYGVIHRLAIGRQFRKLGVAKFVFNICEAKLRIKNIDSMRIDTHEDNIGMQKLLTGLGYKYCGVIFLENGDKRLAFEKVFNQPI